MTDTLYDAALEQQAYACASARFLVTVPPDTVLALIAELRRLRAEVEALREDGARLDWIWDWMIRSDVQIEENFQGEHRVFTLIDENGERYDYGELRAAIDAARNREEIKFIESELKRLEAERDALHRRVEELERDCVKWHEEFARENAERDRAVAEAVQSMIRSTIYGVAGDKGSNAEYIAIDKAIRALDLAAIVASVGRKGEGK